MVFGPAIRMSLITASTKPPPAATPLTAATWDASYRSVQSALAATHAVLGGEELTRVRRAVLLESKDGQISQRDSAQSTLKALGSVQLEYLAV